MSEPRFVICRWLDAWCDGVDDVTIEKVIEKHRPLEMETRGWLLLEDDVGVSLFYERSADLASYRGRTFIPRGMVKSIEDFPPKRKKRQSKPINSEGPI
jgi:hypothetical protein